MSFNVCMTDEITATATANGIKLQCKDKTDEIKSPNNEKKEIFDLEYKDEHTGEYICVSKASEEEGAKIFVKFRSKSCSKMYMWWKQT